MNDLDGIIIQDELTDIIERITMNELCKLSTDIIERITMNELCKLSTDIIERITINGLCKLSSDENIQENKIVSVFSNRIKKKSREQNGVDNQDPDGKDTKPHEPEDGTHRISKLQEQNDANTQDPNGKYMKPHEPENGNAPKDIKMSACALEEASVASITQTKNDAPRDVTLSALQEAIKSDTNNQDPDGKDWKPHEPEDGTHRAIALDADNQDLDGKDAMPHEPEDGTHRAIALDIQTFTTEQEESNEIVMSARTPLATTQPLTAPSNELSSAPLNNSQTETVDVSTIKFDPGGDQELLVNDSDYDVTEDIVDERHLMSQVIYSNQEESQGITDEDEDLFDRSSLQTHDEEKEEERHPNYLSRKEFDTSEIENDLCLPFKMKMDGKVVPLKSYMVFQFNGPINECNLNLLLTPHCATGDISIKSLANYLDTLIAMDLIYFDPESSHQRDDVMFYQNQKITHKITKYTSYLLQKLLANESKCIKRVMKRTCNKYYDDVSTEYSVFFVNLVPRCASIEDIKSRPTIMYPSLAATFGFMQAQNAYKENIFIASIEYCLSQLIQHIPSLCDMISDEKRENESLQLSYDIKVQQRSSSPHALYEEEEEHKRETEEDDDNQVIIEMEKEQERKTPGGDERMEEIDTNERQLQSQNMAKNHMNGDHDVEANISKKEVTEGDKCRNEAIFTFIVTDFSDDMDNNMHDGVCNVKDPVASIDLFEYTQLCAAQTQ
eukprot:1151771_1